MAFTKLTRNQVIATLIAVMVGSAVAHYDDLLPYRWQTYKSADQKFQIDFPGSPTKEELNVPASGGGSITIHGLNTQPSRHVTFACSWMARNSNVLSDDEILDSARDGSLKKMQGSLSSETRIVVQGHFGREVRARVPGNAVVVSRFILVDDRLYLLMIADTYGQEPTKDVKRFFDSFHTA